MISEFVVIELHKGLVLIMTENETGIVTLFDDSDGHGLIKRDLGGEVYFHYSAVNCDESECSMEEGNKVEFTIIKGANGPQAQNVIVLDGNE